MIVIFFVSACFDQAQPPSIWRIKARYADQRIDRSSPIMFSITFCIICSEVNASLWGSTLTVVKYPCYWSNLWWLVFNPSCKDSISRFPSSLCQSQKSEIRGLLFSNFCISLERKHLWGLMLEKSPSHAVSVQTVYDFKKRPQEIGKTWKTILWSALTGRDEEEGKKRSLNQQ